ncbi:hypothetical protein FJ651_09045 [Paucihalobacter ruber]|uniref:HEPN AbiU2-like domain-containing protein n=1 Tax=Paucihalobacter ruber TaxID=2567861 RepID=A0A506PJH1_9FLAO|nr:hypothetical protein [Paucihalobacter ruber]TPV33232.1 hypothetical protein FJ651_09045 [Paucihalobacter ruber]
MEIPIKLESLENDIAECLVHLEYLKKISFLGKEINEFVDNHNLNEKAFIDPDISNAHCIITIAQLETSLILKGLYYSTHELEKKQLLKNGILIIYEAIKSIDEFNKTLNKYSNQYVELKNELNKYFRELKTFKKGIKFDRDIKNIRNNVAGHINKDFIEYSKFMETVDVEKSINFLIAFRYIINGLNDYLFKCIIKE